MSEKELNSIICKKINYYMDINGTTQMELAELLPDNLLSKGKILSVTSPESPKKDS